MATLAGNDRARTASKALRPLVIFKYGFALVGAALLSGALLMIFRTAIFLSSAVETEGVVVELRAAPSTEATIYMPVVEFWLPTGEKIAITSPYGSSSPDYTVGDEIAVFYAAKQPREAQIGDFMSLWGGALVLGSVGGVLFSIGVSFFLVAALAQRRDQHLRTHGVPVDADLLRVELDHSLSVNGRHPYRVLVRGRNPVTSQVEIFRSRAIWCDPSEQLAANHSPARKLTVYVDPHDAKQHCVDISFLS